MTVKVLKKLGINVDDMEKQQQEAIDKDPRNNKKSSSSSSSTSTTKRTRTRKPAEVPEEEKKSMFDTLKDSVMDGLQDMIKLPGQSADSTKSGGEHLPVTRKYFRQIQPS